MQKNTLLILGGITLLLAGFGCAKKADITPAETAVNTSSTPEVGVTTSTPTSTKPVVKKAVKQVTKATSTPAVNLTYSEAVNTYGTTGYRMQFVNCSGKPGSMSIKKGKTFMIDNRDAKPHSIGIGKQTYKLDAYGFALVSPQTTGTYNITCDGGGSAQLYVQP